MNYPSALPAQKRVGNSSTFAFRITLSLFMNQVTHVECDTWTGRNLDEGVQDTGGEGGGRHTLAQTKTRKPINRHFNARQAHTTSRAIKLVGKSWN